MSRTLFRSAELIDERKIRLPDPEQVKRDLAYAHARRCHAWTSNRGWSPDKENQSEAAWPAWLYWQVMSMIDECRDPDERDQMRERLLKQFSKFKTRW